jgi:hypothetical protein
MRRSFALWAGGAAVVAVVVAAVTVAAFPRESSHVQLPAIRVPAPPTRGPVVAVSVDVGRTGQTVSLAVARGGAAIPTPAKADAGVVGFRGATARSQARSTTHRVATPAPVAKTAVKRQVSIGAVSGPNGDTGLAGTPSPTPAVGASWGRSPVGD